MFDFARKWTRSPPDEGVQTVLVLNYADLSGSMIQENARLLGFDTDNSSYLDKKLLGINKQEDFQSLLIYCPCVLGKGAK